MTSKWFSLGPPLSSTNKTNRYDISEIMLKVALNTIKQTNIIGQGGWCVWCHFQQYFSYIMMVILLLMEENKVVSADAAMTWNLTKSVMIQVYGSS